MILYKIYPVFPLLLLLFLACNICADNPQKCMYTLKKMITNQEPEPEPKCGMTNEEYLKLQQWFEVEMENSKKNIQLKQKEYEDNWSKEDWGEICGAASLGASLCDFEKYHEEGIALGYYYATDENSWGLFTCAGGVTRYKELYSNCPKYDNFFSAAIKQIVDASLYEMMNYTEVLNDTKMVNWIEKEYKGNILFYVPGFGKFGETGVERWQLALKRMEPPENYVNPYAPTAPVDDPEKMDKLMRMWLRVRYDTSDDEFANALWQGEVELKEKDPVEFQIKIGEANKGCYHDFKLSYDKQYVKWCGKRLTGQVSAKGFIIKGCFAPCAINGKFIDPNEVKVKYRFHQAKQDASNPKKFYINEIKGVTIKNRNFYFTFMSYDLPGGTIEEGIKNHCQGKFHDIITKVEYKCSGWWYWVLECDNNEGTCVAKPKPYPKDNTPFLILEHTCTLAGASVYQLIRLDKIEHSGVRLPVTTIDLPIKLENAVDNEKYVFDTLEILKKGYTNYQFNDGGKRITEVKELGAKTMNDWVVNWNDSKVRNDKDAPDELKRNMEKYSLVADIPRV